ncbi:MAG TPA: glycosyltransferase family 2 protein [Thermoanaerobaculia bacterium]|nr:glycosyltransferase family 2 protein [Thermoanaerobaculia bacterium]
MGRLVSVVLITWNSAPFLDRCLAGLRNQTHGEIEVIAVDNGSADDSAARVRAVFPAAVVIVNPENRGFSAAVNQAVAVAHGDFVFLCNPDAFLDPGYLERIVAALDVAGESYGSATGKLMRAIGYAIEPTAVVDSKGIRMTRSGRHLDIGQGEPDRPQHRGQRPLAGGDLCEVFGVSGAAAVHRMAFLRDAAIGGEILDEDFFAYREDADLAWRGRILGWRALYVPEAVAWHVRSVTPERRRALPSSVNMHSVKNRFLLRMKNESLRLAIRNALFEIPRDLMAITAALTIERSSFPALTWLWRNRRRVLAKRREIQRRRRVSDRELAGWFE